MDAGGGRAIPMGSSAPCKGALSHLQATDNLGAPGRNAYLHLERQILLSAGLPVPPLPQLLAPLCPVLTASWAKLAHHSGTERARVLGAGLISGAWDPLFSPLHPARQNLR